MWQKNGKRKKHHFPILQRSGGTERLLPTCSSFPAIVFGKKKERVLKIFTPGNNRQPAMGREEQSKAVSCWRNKRKSNRQTKWNQHFRTLLFLPLKHAPSLASGTGEGTSTSWLLWGARGTESSAVWWSQWFAMDCPFIQLLFIAQDTCNILPRWMYFTVMPDQKCCLGAILAWENPKQFYKQEVTPRWHLRGAALKWAHLSCVPGYFRSSQTKPSSAS